MKTAVILTAVITALSLSACGKSEAEKAAEIAQKAENKRKGFHCLSAYDGAHNGVERWLKNNLRDPDSYKHVETKIAPVKDGKHILITSYRAKNGFGGYVGGVVLAEVNHETCQATIISQQ
jgi:hypothetical protein